MSDILTVTGPIYLLIALGYAAGRFGLFPRTDMRTLGRFVIDFALPALLFKALSQRSLAEIMSRDYLLAYAAGSLAALFTGIAVARLARGGSLQYSVFYGMGMSMSNSAFIGYPIALQWLGPSAAVGLALTLTVENVLMLPLALALAESGAGGGQTWRRVVLRSLGQLLCSPMILAILAGLAFGSLGLRLPAPVARAVDLLAAASTAAALFVIGGTLVGLRVKGMLGDVALIALGKLLLHPLAVLAALLVLPPLEPQLRMAALTFSCMPMLGIYPVLAQRYGQEGFCAAALLATTIASFGTISAILWIMRLVPGWVG